LTKNTSANSLRSQIRQGIANQTKGTAYVVYEDVMDSKQACDKLNGFNFQNRYLVGKSGTFPNSHSHSNNLYSALPSTREDGSIERGFRIPQGEFRAAQETTWYRITNRRACGRNCSSMANASSALYCTTNEQQQPQGFCEPVFKGVSWSEGQFGNTIIGTTSKFYCYPSGGSFSFLCFHARSVFQVGVERKTSLRIRHGNDRLVGWVFILALLGRTG
jgi:hypothetical protein